MSYLLDSQIIIWHKMRREQLSSRAITLLEDCEVKLVTSLVSFWELTIKESLGKLDIPDQVSGLYKDWLSISADLPLAITWNHIQLYKTLPLIHRDPFDRMLIAQALVEDLTILTCDDNIRKYPEVKTVW